MEGHQRCSILLLKEPFPAKFSFNTTALKFGVILKPLISHFMFNYSQRNLESGPPGAGLNTPDVYHTADTDLLLWGVCKHPGNEDAVRDELQPSIHKTRCFSRPQDVEGVAERDNAL